MALVEPPGYLQAGTYTAADDRLYITSNKMQRSVLDTFHVGARGGFSAGRWPDISFSGFTVTVGPCAGTVENNFATTSGDYDFVNGENVNVTVQSPSATQGRIDTLGIQVEDAFYLGTANDVQIVLIQGTPSAGTPVAPQLPFGFLTIGDIFVAANAQSVTTASFTDHRRVTVATGGITPPVTIDQIGDNGFPGEFRYRGDTGELQVNNGLVWQTVGRTNTVRTAAGSVTADVPDTPIVASWMGTGTPLFGVTIPVTYPAGVFDTTAGGADIFIGLGINDVSPGTRSILASVGDKTATGFNIYYARINTAPSITIDWTATQP